MNDGKIHITARQREYTSVQACIKLSPKAYNLLIDVVEESGRISIKEAASEIIIQAIEKRLICFDREVG